MKAEQRKELETNTLADRMGQAMQRVKTSPRRTFLIYLVILALIVAGLYIAVRWRITSQLESSKQWIQLYHGSRNNLISLEDKEGTTPAGKAARFQIVWLEYWELGVKMMGTNPTGSMTALTDASKRYRGLAEDCKDDPLFEPQALLGIAVVEETKSIQNQDNLEKAVDLYETVVTKYKDTAEGKFAQNRLDMLKDQTKRKEVATVYRELQALLGVRPPLQQPHLDIPGIPPPNLPDKKEP